MICRALYQQCRWCRLVSGLRVSSTFLILQGVPAVELVTHGVPVSDTAFGAMPIGLGHGDDQCLNKQKRGGSSIPSGADLDWQGDNMAAMTRRGRAPLVGNQHHLGAPL